jgi:uroporphyrinogen-III decarboxylase
VANNLKMTGRERIMAAMAFKEVDKIPFVPLIDDYTLRDMPSEITGGLSSRDPYTTRMAVASRALGCDLLIRHVRLINPPKGAIHLQLLGGFGPEVETKIDFKDGVLVETLITPIGTLTGHWAFSDKVGSIPHAIKHVVNNLEEMKIFRWAVDHMDLNRPEPLFENFNLADQDIGEDGIATTSFNNTPLMFLIEMVWGLENTYYLLNDYPQEVEDILQRLHLSLKRQLEVIIESPARVVIEYENTSSTLLSPKMFRKYVLPCMNEYANILRSAGKIYLVHMCGRLRAFKEDLAKADFHGIIDAPPPPTGDFPLDEAAAGLPGKVVIGGIDPTTFISPDPAFVEAEISGLLERLKPFRGVMLGSADVAPRGALPENFKLIRRIIDTFSGRH